MRLNPVVLYFLNERAEGGVTVGALRAAGAAMAVGAGVAALGIGSAGADELVMPYACRVSGGQVSLERTSLQKYVISGNRAEQVYRVCDGAACIDTVAHKFDIACQGGAVSWARIAGAVTETAAMPLAGSPPGYAPLGPLEARLILPALARFAPHHEPSVSSEALSPDGVVVRDRAERPAFGNSWAPVVEAEAVTPAAMRAAGVIALLLAGFSILGLGAASRTGHIDLRAVWTAYFESARGAAAVFSARMRAAMGGLRASIDKLTSTGTENSRLEIVNALSAVLARATSAASLIAVLPASATVRGVLESELGTVSRRIEDVRKRMDQRDWPRCATLLRVSLRDLDRIEKIARGALRDHTVNPAAAVADKGAMPQTVAEAYGVLGLNHGASPQVAKKLVDALRMSWHPDHARDDADRQQREVRMKQINAAWELVRASLQMAA